MKIRHHSIFTELNSNIIDWNKLRNSKVEKAYYIPYTKEEYLDMLESEIKIVSKHLDSIINYCDKNNITKIVSIGAGRAVLEYALLINSNITITVTDVSESILRIKEFNVFDDAYQLNLIDNQIDHFDKSTLVLLCRIDTEFDDTDFQKLFYSLFQNGACQICFIPAELLTIKTFLIEIKLYFLTLFSKRKRVFCGYARTKSEYLSHWKSYFENSGAFSRKEIFYLKRKP